jgi:hypothetical protein
VTRTPPKTALPRRLLLVLGGLLVGLCLAEIGMRLWAPPGVGFVLDATTSSFDPEMFEEDPVLLQRLRPSTRSTFESVAGRRSLRVNALGLRGPELGKKGAEEIRVLALGDSFTLGLQVDELDTWSARLSEHLSSQVGTQVSVLNGGMVGYGTRQAAHRLGELAEITQADAASAGTPEPAAPWRGPAPAGDGAPRTTRPGPILPPDSARTRLASDARCQDRLQAGGVPR